VGQRDLTEVLTVVVRHGRSLGEWQSRCQRETPIRIFPFSRSGMVLISLSAPRRPTSMLEVVTLKEIDAIFAVTDALGIHREMLVIPLGPASPGRVRRLPSGKLEIVVEARRPIEEWVKELPKLIAAAQGT